jgi:alkaline phosphatase D
LVCTYQEGMYAQKSLLKSGPLLGPTSLRDVTLWLQTTQEATVHFTYMEKGSKEAFRKSERVTSKKVDGYTVQIHLSDVIPGTHLYLQNFYQ